MTVLLALLAFAQAAALPAAAPAAPPPAPYQSLAGPRTLCTEYFTVRLEAGERLAWRFHPHATAGIWYVILSRGAIFTATPWRTALPAPRGTRIDLGPETLAEAQAVDLRRLPEMRGPDGRHQGPDFDIRFLLHGPRRVEHPLIVSLFDGDPRIVPPIVRRVTPGTMAARGCRTPAHRDPALAGAIERVYPYAPTAAGPLSPARPGD